MLLSVVFRCQMGSEELMKSEFIKFGSNPETLKLRVGSILVIDQEEQVYKLIVRSRLASRALMLLQRGFVESDLDLYNLAFGIQWLKYIHPRAELKINFKGTNRQLINSHYSTQKLKDAIVDHYTRNDQVRPMINIEQPDIIIDARLHHTECEISLDLTGPMHKRFRSQTTLAPIRETLASMLISRTGWQGDTPIVDPFCGSGSFLIEASMIALNKAPGVYRENKVITAWKNFNQELWQATLDQAKADELQSRPGFKAYGSDTDPEAIFAAKNNAAQVGVSQFIEWHVSDATKLTNLSNKESGLIITNPPYGERLDNVGTLIPVYQRFSNQVKANFPNWTMAVICSQEMLLTSLRLRANKTWKVKNGNLDCIFKLFTIGAKKDNLETNEIVEQDNSQSIELRAQELLNRLDKNAKKIKNYLQKNSVSCYRLYDADLPNYNFAVDVYTPDQSSKLNKLQVVVQEYQAPNTMDPVKTQIRLLDGVQAVQVFFGDAHVVVKQRQRQRGASQYNKLASKDNNFLVKEDGAYFYVNIEDYLDTGIFLDHREVRKYIKSKANGKSFLNLFAYTSTASVHAILAGATTSLSVDLSKSYTNWSEVNFDINDIDPRQHEVLRADVLAWLDYQTDPDYKPEYTFDLIFLDPPTFSNSKKMDNTWEVSKDYLDILEKLQVILNPNGELVFSNNRRDFKLDHTAVEELGYQVTDITKQTMPEDFRDQKIHQVWSLIKTK